MSLPALCTVGAFGRFKYGGRKLVETWQALEDIAHDEDWWIGIYSMHNVLEYGEHRGLLTPAEIAMFREAFE